MRYLVKMTPLEPYAFGTDQSFKFAGVKNMAKETYFVRSKKIPEQTTILGALRYLLLQSEGLLKTDFYYTKEEKEKMNIVIGERSFSFEEERDFGYLEKISPVFLIDKENHCYVRNPFHNKEEQKGYRPMQMMENTLRTSYGEIRLPVTEEYNAKDGYAGGFISLFDKKIMPEWELFESAVLTGNRKSEQKKKDDDGFFKREVIALKEGLSFGVYVDAKNLPENGIVFMGQKKSAFHITVEAAEEADLEKQVQTAFAGGNTWWYALSDFVVREDLAYDTFCIIEQKKVQNLETYYKEQNHTRKLQKSERQYQLIQSGSVFYDHCPVKSGNERYQKIGYNYIVKIGGEQS